MALVGKLPDRGCLCEGLTNYSYLAKLQKKKLFFRPTKYRELYFCAH
jgi:hypothetical protein